MKNQNIIICGKKQSGKTSVFNYLQTKNLDDYYFGNLADDLKMLLSIEFRRYVEKECFYGTDADKNKGLLLSNRDVRDAFKSIINSNNFINYIKLFDRDSISSFGSGEYYIDDISRLIDDVVIKNKEVWTARKLMQCFGTDIMCTVFPNYWIYRFIVNYIKSGKKYYVVGDCRQQHEFDYFSSMGCNLIRIKRPDTDDDTPHPTENIIGDVNIVINNSSKEELFKKVEELL